MKYPSRRDARGVFRVDVSKFDKLFMDSCAPRLSSFHSCQITSAVKFCRAGAGHRLAHFVGAACLGAACSLLMYGVRRGRRCLTCVPLGANLCQYPPLPMHSHM